MTFVIILTLVAIAIAAFFLLKKTKKFQKLESVLASVITESAIYKTDKPQAYRATIELEDHPNLIRPESYQQRNLDREVGGLEEGKKGSEKENEELKEKIIEDTWDKRSEEVDKMGSFNPLAGSNKESMTWRLKKIRLGIGKHLNHDQDENVAEKKVGNNFDSRYNQQGGFSQIVKARQDFGHENDGGGMGMGR